MVIGSIDYQSLQARTELVEAYHKYVLDNLAPGREKYPKCGKPALNDFGNRYAFYFPDNSPNEFYVDDEGNLQYFIFEKGRGLSRKWSATIQLKKSSFKPSLNNNFLSASLFGAGSMINVCGNLPSDKRPMDIYYSGHTYARLTSNAIVVCRQSLGNQLDIEFKNVVSIRKPCNIK